MTVASIRRMPLRKRIFVCVQNRPIGHPRGSCQSRSGGLVYQTFLDELSAHAGVGYQLTSTGCLGPCASGASVLVYPEGILYGRVTPGDVPEIVQQHLVAGRPVARLVVEDTSL
jgi:(2Fe-2S) ferredoxin